MLVRSLKLFGINTYLFAIMKSLVTLSIRHQQSYKQKWQPKVAYRRNVAIRIKLLGTKKVFIRLWH